MKGAGTVKSEAAAIRKETIFPRHWSKYNVLMTEVYQFDIKLLLSSLLKLR